MVELNPYVRALYLSSFGLISMPAELLRKEEVIPIIKDGFIDLSINFELGGLVDNDALSYEMFDVLMENEVIIEEDYEFAGKYYQFIPNRYSKFREKFLEADSIAKASQRVGKRYFPDVFKGYKDRAHGIVAEILVPASDRVVTLGDNHPVVASLNDLAGQVRTSNSVQEELGDNGEEVNAELEAAVALTKSDRVSLRALLAILSKALKYLADKFAGSGIGELAKELIQMLVNLH